MRGFLKDLLELVKRDYDTDDLKDFENTILKGCDFNRDGKINKKVKETYYMNDIKLATLI